MIPVTLIIFIIALLERQIVSWAWSKIHSRRRHRSSRGSISSRHLSSRPVRWHSRRCHTGLGSSRRLVGSLRFPGTDIYIPTPVELSAIDVKTYFHHLTYLKGELVDTVTKEIKCNFLGISLLGFKHIFALLPYISLSRGTSHFGQSNYDLACNFHIIYLLFLFLLLFEHMQYSSAYYLQK